MAFSNDLTPGEAERLALLAEECAEVIAIVGKVLRHGYESYNPDHGFGSPTNRRLLEKELGDVKYAVELMRRCRDIDGKHVDGYAETAIPKKRRYLHHQAPDC